MPARNGLQVDEVAGAEGAAVVVFGAGLPESVEINDLIDDGERRFYHRLYANLVIGRDIDQTLRGRMAMAGLRMSNFRLPW